MSIEILKAGIADSVQDNGRYGYQHLGIHTSGAMDNWAMRIANVLVNNPQHYAVLEMAFPAGSMKFNCSALIALTGADFKPLLNGRPFPLWKPAVVTAGSVLEFSGLGHGSFCYLAVHGGFRVKTWLGSNSTSAVACRGGLKGRFMRTGDILELNSTINARDVHLPSFRAKVDDFYLTDPVKCLPGTGVYGHQIPAEAAQRFIREKFVVHPQSNRMGYRLRALEPLPAPAAGALSDAVTFGAIQLLPNGELVALMADHQTTGGYPCIGVIAQACRPAFVQRRPGEAVRFAWISLADAQQLYVAQFRTLQQLAYSCRYHLKDFFHEKN